jgi:hypothetical protein
MRQRKKDPGQRGKYAEDKVKALLMKLGEQYADFDWQRMYDARAAGGRFQSQVGDYEFFTRERHGVIEAKEIEHDFRLPASKLPQLPRLRKRQIAGGLIVVLVLHTTKDMWRLVPFDWLWPRRDQASWDLSEFPGYEKLENIHGLLSALVGMRALAK